MWRLRMEKHDLAFWLAALGATIVKLFTAPYSGFVQAFITVFAAVFSAYFLTSPALDILGLDPEIYTTAMAALMALTGEGFMRWLIGASNDPSKIFEILKQWRGGGK
jgi:hypothetical protein